MRPGRKLAANTINRTVTVLVLDYLLQSLKSRDRAWPPAVAYVPFMNEYLPYLPYLRYTLKDNQTSILPLNIALGNAQASPNTICHVKMAIKKPQVRISFPSTSPVPISYNIHSPHLSNSLRPSHRLCIQVLQLPPTHTHTTCLLKIPS